MEIKYGMLDPDQQRVITNIQYVIKHMSENKVRCKPMSSQLSVIQTTTNKKFKYHRKKDISTLNNLILPDALATIVELPSDTTSN